MLIKHSSPVTLICVLIVCIAGCSDIRGRIIPNSLTVTGAVGGIVYHLFSSPWPDGLVFSGAGLLSGGALLIIPFVKQWTGAGDVKMLAALGAWLGPVDIVHVFLYGTLAGGVMATCQIIRNRQLFRTFQTEEAKSHHDTAGQTRLTGLPYALALGGGYIGFLIWGRIF